MKVSYSVHDDKLVEKQSFWLAGRGTRSPLYLTAWVPYMNIQRLWGHITEKVGFSVGDEYSQIQKFSPCYQYMRVSCSKHTVDTRYIELSDDTPRLNKIIFLAADQDA